jgi:hypothetical protein
MPSMVSANRFINTVVLPLVIVAYGVYLLIDHVHNNQLPASGNHIQRIQKIGSIDGLLFGGSNVVYSLSAELLSYHTGMKWYNASVLGEWWSIERHKNFIQDLSTRIDRTKVRYVVYSSIAPYQKEIIARAESRENLATGKNLGTREDLGISIKPKISILGYIHHHSLRNSDQRDNFLEKRDRFGDKVFENLNCRFTAEDPVSHQREDVDNSAEFLADYANFFASLFPNAAILIVLPSEYYGALSFDDSIFEQTLRTKFYSVLNAKYSKNGFMKIIFQPPYTSIKQVCDGRSHANEDGRLWRTRNLVESMREIVPSNTAMTQ